MKTLFLLPFIFYFGGGAFGGLTNPTNLTFESCNLNLIVRWDSPEGVRTFNGLPDRYGNDDVFYSVYYLEDIDENDNVVWLPLSNCTLIRGHYCEINIELSPFLTCEFAVTAQTESICASPITEDNIKEFTMYIDGFLCAPNFLLDIYNNVATINITKPPKITWSGQLLTDALVGEDFKYEIEYWNNTNTKFHERFKLMKPASTTAVNISLQESLGYCVRIKVTSISFDSKGWSDIVCKNRTTEEISQFSNHNKAVHVPATLKAIFGCFAAVTCIGLMIGFCRLTKRLVVFVKGKDDRIIPQSLSDVMIEILEKPKIVEFYETEKITMFTSNSNDHSSNTSYPSKMLGKSTIISSLIIQDDTFASENNIYPLLDSNAECSDYVKSVSTPDSGVFSYNNSAT